MSVLPCWNTHFLVASLLLIGGASPRLLHASPRPEETPADRGEQEKFFESRIRPLLAQHCVECHGPDDQSGELRLDRQVHFQAGGGSGKLVEPGKPEESLLVRAIGYRDNDLQMPPDNKLADEEIALLTEWVRQGAFWPDDGGAGKDGAAKDQADGMSAAGEVESPWQAGSSHWAFQPIVAGKPPEVNPNHSSTSSGLTAIDQFVLARLDDTGLSPNPPADRRVLIHRAYFTLLGLPPTYEEVQSFLADESPDAFARLVDRLLDNPHYGERWARHWLDIARYADTMGYLAGSRDESYPFAFTYRDYVIDAFNSDKPFNQFIVEQIAADQLDLSGSDKTSLAAMGFLTVGRRFMNREPDIIDDQIDVMTRGFLGISVACARCHDHKYDPIPTADYYSLYGVFASSQEPSELPLLSEPQPSPEYDAFLQAKAEKQKEVDRWVEERRVEIEHELRSRVADYLFFIASSLPQYRKGKTSLQGKRGALRPAAVQRWQQYLLDPDASSNPVWNLLRQLAQVEPKVFAEESLKIIEALEPDYEAETAKEGAAVNKLPMPLLDALKEARPETFPDAARVLGEQLEAVYAKWDEASKADRAIERLDDDADEALRQLLWSPGAPTTLDAAQTVRHLDQGERNEYNRKVAGVNRVEATHPGAPPRGMILVDKNEPVEPVIFRRGIPSNRGDQVPRRFLQVLSHVDGGKPFQDGSGRLELARAIANPENPLTPRVIVNRIWQHHFGEGLVRTPSDFGVRGEPPTHPELLDFLAAEFIDSGWSIKSLQRRIMLSATWQQSSELRHEAMLADPENRLLWHMPRRRLEFEPLRDRLLVAAGRLDDRIGGRSVMIHQDAKRRGLYAYIDREDPPGLLANFDFPSPDASRAKRTQTTVPQQALYLMNSAFVIDQAKALAERSAAKEDELRQEEDASSRASVDPAERIRRIYRHALSRDPDDQETQSAISFVNHESDPEVDPWVQLAQALLLCNEFAFVD